MTKKTKEKHTARHSERHKIRLTDNTERGQRAVILCCSPRDIYDNKDNIYRDRHTFRKTKQAVDRR